MIANQKSDLSSFLTEGRQECLVSFDCLSIGNIVHDSKDKLYISDVPDEPGAYKIILEYEGVCYVYVGESKSVRNRFKNYRNPNVSQKTSMRIHKKIDNILKNGGNAEMFIVSKGYADKKKLNLGLKSNRVLLESLILLEVKNSDCTVLNK